MEPRARFELAFPDYRSGASPSMLTGLVILEPMERIERSSVAYHATALPLSYIGWSQRGYSKSRPPRYECGALPLELLRLGAGAENRTPLAGPAIRCPTNRPHPRNVGADGDNRNLFSGSEAQGTPYIPRPLETDSIVKDRGTMDTLRPSYFPGKVSSTMSQNSRIKRKKGRPFWWPPLLETGMLFQDGQVTSRAS